MPGINIFDMLKGAAGGQAFHQVAQQTGLSDNQAEMAIKALLPAIAGGLQRNVQQPGGLQALLGALNSGQHDQYLAQPERIARPEAIQDGNSILGHLLGSKDTSRAVAAQAAQRTGIDVSLLKRILPMVATMAMGSLSKQTKEPSMVQALAGVLGGVQPQPTQRQPAGLGDLLGSMLGSGQSQSAPQTGAMGMLGGLLDADGDGNAMDDIFAMVMKRT